MKIQLLSDIHLEFEDYTWRDIGADVVVLAGDIGVGLAGVKWALETITKPVFYVFGNHEFYHHTFPDLLFSARSLCRDTHVRLADNDAFIIDNTEFVGCTLWTDFALHNDIAYAQEAAAKYMADYRVIQSGSTRPFSPDRTAHVHFYAKEWLKEVCAKPRTTKHRVIVTHHAPSEKSVPEQYKGHALTPAFASDLEDFLPSLDADLWCHGHMHEFTDYQIGSTRVMCNPRGYPEEEGTRFDEGLLIELPPQR